MEGQAAQETKRYNNGSTQVLPKSSSATLTGHARGAGVSCACVHIRNVLDQAAIQRALSPGGVMIMKVVIVGTWSRERRAVIHTCVWRRTTRRRLTTASKPRAQFHTGHKTPRVNIHIHIHIHIQKHMSADCSRQASNDPCGQCTVKRRRGRFKQTEMPLLNKWLSQQPASRSSGRPYTVLEEHGRHKQAGADSERV